MRYEIVTLTLILILVVMSASIGYLARNEITSMIIDIRHQEVSTPEECQNLTMEDTAYCLNEYVRGIFKYKTRPDNENPTLEELKEEGGDCKNWAELYVRHIKDLGFSSTRPVIYTGDDGRHTFATISDETGYCILDQRTIRCVRLRD